MSYTMDQYVAEVRMRLPRYAVLQTIDDQSIVTYVNTARHIVQMSTLQVVPERYARQWVPSALPVESAEESVRATVYDTVGGGATTVLNRAYVYSMPDDFLDIVDVWHVDISGIAWPARRVSKREFYTAMTRTWTMPTTGSAIYCVEKRVADSAYRMVVSAGDFVLTDTNIEAWYLAKLPYMQIVTNSLGATDTDFRIGYDLQELVINLAALRITEKFGPVESRELILQEINAGVSAFEAAYKGSIDRSLLLTEAREGTIPNRPIVEV